MVSVCTLVTDWEFMPPEVVYCSAPEPRTVLSETSAMMMSSFRLLQILTKLASQSSGGAPLLALLEQARRGISAQQPAAPAGMQIVLAKLHSHSSP